MLKVKEQLTKEVGLPTGAVRQLFTVDGKLVKDIESLEDGAKYVAAGAEKLKLDSRKNSW